MKIFKISMFRISGVNFCFVRNNTQPYLEKNEIDNIINKCKEYDEHLFLIIENNNSVVFFGTGTDMVYDAYIRNNYFKEKEFTYDAFLKLVDISKELPINEIFN